MEIKNDSLLNQIDISRQTLSNNRITHKSQGNKGHIGDASSAAKEFESMFLAKMFNILFENVKPNALLGGGNAETIYKSMMADEYAKIVSNSNTTNIADTIQAQILRLQEVN